MVGILGVDVEDGAVVLIDARRRSRMGANFHPLDSLSVDGLEVRGVEALDGS
jgi:hypothetical protein